MRWLTIGRGRKADVVVSPKHSKVSRMHARVTELTGRRYLIEDLGSTAGTFVRSKDEWRRVTRAHVDARDSIKLGNLETSIDVLIGLQRTQKNNLPPSYRQRSGRGPEIFVSYAREDIEDVRPLVALFEQQGWNVFWDRKINPGQQWSNEIEQALAAAKLVIVVWSRTSVRSEWVKAEAMAAWERQALLPVRIDEASVPPPFSLVQTTDLWGITSQSDQTETMRQLLNAVGSMIDRAGRSELSNGVAAGLFRAAPIYSGFNFTRVFFDLNGRLNRLHFLLGTIVLTVLGFVVSPLVTSTVLSVSFAADKLETQIASAALATLILIYPAVCIYVKRLHDINFSGYWTILIVAMGLLQQGVSIGFLALNPLERAKATAAHSVIMLALAIPSLVLLLWPGNRSANRFGPPPVR